MNEEKKKHIVSRRTREVEREKTTYKGCSRRTWRTASARTAPVNRGKRRKKKEKEGKRRKKTEVRRKKKEGRLSRRERRRKR